ncbi:MAG: deoxyribodipyrimidine photo-lyase [Chitinophagaceae bacterium]|nr:deoxyribodipyrimidine photo-lyase [Chitinophagaceae bacterium]
MNVFWFRRDLRLHDNAGLYQALKDAEPVLPVFIFDTNILDELEDEDDARVHFIHDTLAEMNELLAKRGSSLHVYHGTPEKAFTDITERFTVNKVFTNSDAELYALERDKAVMELLAKKGIAFQAWKDQVIFGKDEILKEDGEPYVIYTPYSKKWKSKLTDFYTKAYPVEKYFANFFKSPSKPVPSLESIGFKKSSVQIPPKDIPDTVFREYEQHRDFPGDDATSRLGIHLRFGTISIRELVARAKDLSQVYLNELIWREFYQMILAHFPHVGRGEAFKKEYDAIQWRYDEKEFKLWCEGRTGYPLVDAGMRQLNETGFMHNRVRMVTASFLAKHLLVDWRWGEAYFARKLLDFDFANNNGGWQWSVGCGCDAAPYFRIFNPSMQTEKFDAKLKYIRRWVPELETFEYPSPVVDHTFARKRCLEVYGKALNK